MEREITFNISNEDHDTMARTGRLAIRDSIIKTPIFWLGHQLKSKPHPWQHFDVFGVLVNACNILSSLSASEKIEKIGIRKFLGFNGPIMMDSGGFLFQRKRTVDVNPLRIMDPYLYIFKTDYEDFILDLFSELPITCWFQRVSNTLICYIWALREPVKETTTHLERIPELQIPLLVEALMKKGVITKENQARRRYYWRKEIGDI